MKRQKGIRFGVKRAAAFALTLLMLVQGISPVHAAGEDHEVTIFYGYGGKAGSENPATEIFKKGLDDKAYFETAKHGFTDGDFHTEATSGKATAYGQGNPPAAAKRVDIIYGNLTYTFNSYINNAVLYLSADGTELNLKSGTKLMKFGGSDAWGASKSSGVIRFFHIAEDLTIVYHYADEVALRINAGEGAAYDSESGFPGYSDVDGGTFVGYSRPRTIKEGFDTSIKVPEGKTIDYLKLRIGEKELTIPNAAVREGTYVNSSYELTDDSKDAILYYKGEKLTTYAIQQNISLDVEYAHTITFDAEKNGGELVDPAKATATTVDGKIAEFPEVKDRSKEDPAKYFTGWFYDGKAVDAQTVFTSDATLEARWSETVYTVTYKIGHGNEDYTTKVGEGGIILDIPEDPAAKDGSAFYFMGWYTTEDGTDKFDFANTKINQDTTVYAHWSDTLYKVEFKASDDLYSFEDQLVSLADPYVKKPDDPMVKGYALSGFYADPNYETEFDFAKEITQNTTIYVKFERKYTIQAVGAEGSSTAITSSEFKNYVAANGGSVDEVGGTIEIVGSYEGEKGIAIAVNAAYGKVSELIFEMGGRTWTFKGTALTGTYTSFVNASYDEVERENYEAGDIFKYAHSLDKATQQSNNFYNFRLYKINENITITVHYEDREAEVVDEKGYFDVIHYDRLPQGGDAVETGNALRVSSRYLRGSNDYSYRIALRPSNIAALAGIHVSDASGKYEADLAVPSMLSGTYGSADNPLGQIAYSYTGGIYYVRVQYQNAGKLIFTPILDFEYENKGYSDINLQTSGDLVVRTESGYPSSVQVSYDYRNIKVPQGALTDGVAGKSFRWSLGSTLDNELEYFTLEIWGTYKDGTGTYRKTMLATLGGDAESYLANTKEDQTFTYDGAVSVKYNKSKYGTAQIRLWDPSGAMDFELRMNYKNYKTGEVVAASDAKFDNMMTIQVDGAHSSWDVDREMNGMFADKANNRVTFNGKYMSGVNTPDGNGLYGCIRFVITELSGYEISSLTITEKGNSKNTYTFQAANGKPTATYSSGMGTIYFSFDNGKYYVRFADLTVRNVVISADYRVLHSDPHTVSISGIAKGNTELTVSGDDISGVTFSKDLLNVRVNAANTLTDSVTGKSVRWEFSSTYGSGWEYYKVEIYSADSGQLFDTLGADFVSFLAEAKDQAAGSSLPGLSVRYSKDKSGSAYLRIWNVSKNYDMVLYYKNYATGQVVASNQATVNVNYGGRVSYTDSQVRLKVENAASTTVNVNRKLSREDGIKYYVYTKTLGDNVESISIVANGRTYEIGRGFKSGQSAGLDVLGAKVNYYKNTDGWAQIRVWNVVGNISFTTNLSHNNKYTIFFDEGEHGVFKVTEMPETATFNNNMSQITVLQGSVYDSRQGNGTSVRYDVTPDVGYEIDCVNVTVGGQTWRLDHRELESGKTLTAKVLPNTAIRYNVDSNGAQIRMVHVDEDTHVQVTYREDEYSLTVFTQYKGVMKAEAYETSELFTEFTDNFAVAKVVSGTTMGRTNGIKYWIKPIQKGDEITNAVVRNKFGDYLIMGDDFTEEQWQDYRIKGGVVRYYKGYDGIIELRIWGIYEDLEVITFYNGETPDPYMVIPDDVGTYDLGPYGDDEGYQDEIIKPMSTEVKKRSVSWVTIVVCVLAALVIAGLATFLILFLKKRRTGNRE